MQFLDIPLGRDYRWFLSILCCIRIFPYDGHIKGCCKYFLDFSHCGAGLSLKYDSVSYVYYVVPSDMPLICDCRIFRYGLQ